MPISNQTQEPITTYTIAQSHSSATIPINSVTDMNMILCQNSQNDNTIDDLHSKRKPWHVRMKKYQEVRTRIFGETSMKIQKTRQRYKRRKQTRIDIAAANIYEGSDSRIYTTIEINKIPIQGLLDSGATVSCLGTNCLDFVERAKLIIYPFNSRIRTADGRLNSIIGRVRSDIHFNGITKPVDFYLVPSLKLELFLGIDFMTSFNLIRLDVHGLSHHETLAEDEAETSYPRMHTLDQHQRQILDDTIAIFPCFTRKGLGKTHLEIHHIDTGSAVPIKEKHYPISPAVQKLMYGELDRMISLGVIEPSESPWNNRVTFVQKGEKVRICLDARRLNDLTVKDAYPLPHIEGLLSRLGDTHFISSIDLKDAFWQIPLAESSREKTAFTVPGRPLYHFTVMPFGLCNAAQRLCRLMDKVIPARLREKVFVYLDDLLVVSAEFSEHIRLLTEVARCLVSAGLTINVGKSRFCCRELKYLGYIVGGGLLKPDPEKIRAIEKFAYPSTAKQVRSFLGTTGWYRRFIHYYALIAAPISETLKKGKRFMFSEEAKSAFDKLKECLIKSPVLSNPDFNKIFFIQCDASDVGVGAVIFQEDEEGGEHPIEYFSKKLTTAQRNYSVTERECLAVVLAVKRFRPYIDLMKFVIITDHSSLKWLMSQRDLNGRLARWSLQLQSFNFEIQHRKGSQNIVPDMLSRYDLDEMDIHPVGLIDLQSSAFLSEEYCNLKKTIHNEKDLLPDVRIVDQFVYKRTVPYSGDASQEEHSWKLWVPSELTNKIITEAHQPPNVSHGGIGKTIRRIREYFYWPHMNVQIRDFINRCDICKESKPSNMVLKPPMGREPDVGRPFQRIYVDFLGPYVRSKKGNCFIFIVLDYFSKYVFLKPMAKANSRNVIDFLIREIFYKFGCPETLVSDNGVQFTSKEFADLMKTFDIEHLRTANYAPQANASERVNQSVLAAIRSYLNDNQQDWDLHICEIECALRSAVHSAIGATPYFILFGNNMITHASAYKLMRKLNLLEDSENRIENRHEFLEIVRDNVKKNLHKSYESNARKYNIRCRSTKFIEGQEVFRRNFQQSNFTKQVSAKLCKKFIKCRIVRKVGANLYEVENLQGKTQGIFHAKDLKA